MAVRSALGRSEAALAALATVTVLLITWYIKGKWASQSQRRKLPPGPKGWPILGSLPMLGKLPHQDLFKLSKQYGPLMMMKLGSVNTLVVSSPKFAEAILKTHDLSFANRPQLVVAKVFSYNYHDVAYQSYGHCWRNLRKICTVGLLTANRLAQFQDVRKQEVMDVLHFVLQETKLGNAVNMAECFSIITINNMTQMTLRQRFCSLSPSSDISENNSWMPDAIRELFVCLGSINISDFVPVLKPFDPQGLHKRIRVVMKKLDGVYEEIIAERRQRKASDSSGGITEDFTDALLGYSENDAQGERLSMEEVKATLVDMLAGGGDTSAATSLWALAELLKHPSTMKKLQAELDAVVGPNRLVQEADLPNLPYLAAVVKETLRLHPAGPLLIPHQLVQECDVEGFHIPAKTQIFVNVWGIHRTDAWERPLEFDPDRFLNSTKDFRGQDFDYLPFGSGRRICPGMNVGVLMVSYPVASLVHAIEWILPEGQKPEEIDMGELFGLVLHKEQPLRVFGKGRLPDHVLYPAQDVSKQ